MYVASSTAIRPEKPYAKRRRTEDLLHDEAPGNPKFSKKYIRQIERTLDRLSREIEEMAASGEYDPRPGHRNAEAGSRANRNKIFEDIESALSESQRDAASSGVGARQGCPGLPIGRILPTSRVM